MIQKFYAVKNVEEKQRIISSSGGIFLPIAERIIEKHGVVYGAAYNNDFEVEHYRVEKKEDLFLLTGTKYSQSNINNVIQQIKKDIESNKTILFVGTPCQVKTIKAIAKGHEKKLITIDLICHGTPEKQFLKDYISFMEKKYNSKVTEINMRFKNEKVFKKNIVKKKALDSIVQPKYMKISFANGKTYIERSNFDPYYQLFDLMIRKGCFKCPFASLDRIGDITIGDYHEFNTKLGDFNDGNGVSLVIVNTTKGLSILKESEECFCIQQKSKDECMQPALSRPTDVPSKYDEFHDDYTKNGFDYVLRKYVDSGITFKIKKFLYKAGLFDFIKKLIKKKS